MSATLDLVRVGAAGLSVIVVFGIALVQVPAMDSYLHRPDSFGQAPHGGPLAQALSRLEQPTIETAVLTGRVLMEDSSEAPIRNAEVLLHDLGLGARTDSAGRYSVGNIPLGLHRVLVRAFGFEPLELRVAFMRPDTLQRDFLISKKAVAVLEEVNVKASTARSEFEERRLLRNGHFLDRSDLEDAKARKLSDVLSRIPGVRIMRGNLGRAWIANSRGTSSIMREFVPDRFDQAQGARRACYAHVYVDDAITFGGVGPLFDINSIPPSEIEAIEYYSGAAQIPPKYNRTGSACGVLVIWTKNR